MITAMGLAAVALYCLLGSIVAWQDTYELTYNVTTNSNTHFLIHFPLNRFNEFYRCLCDNTGKGCTVYVDSKRVVSNTQWVTESESSDYLTRYKCNVISYSNNVISCNRLNKSAEACSLQTGCHVYTVNDRDCRFSPVEITWDTRLSVSQWYNSQTLIISSCQSSCSQTPVLPTITSSHSNTTVTASFTKPIHTTVSDEFANMTDSVAEMSGEDDNSGVIAGAVVGILIFIAAVLVLGILLWKHGDKIIKWNRKVKRTNTLPSPWMIPNSLPTQSVETTYCSPIILENSAYADRNGHIYANFPSSENSATLQDDKKQEGNYTNNNNYCNIRNNENDNECSSSVDDIRLTSKAGTEVLPTDKNGPYCEAGRDSNHHQVDLETNVCAAINNNQIQISNLNLTKNTSDLTLNKGNDIDNVKEGTQLPEESTGYSRLYDQPRHHKHPYNVVTSSQSDLNHTKLSSAHSFEDKSIYCLAGSFTQPNNDTYTYPAIQIIDLSLRDTPDDNNAVMCDKEEKLEYTNIYFEFEKGTEMQESGEV